GQCTVSATMPGDGNYNDVTATATVALQKADQAALTLNAGSPLMYNSTETLTTTGGSGTGAVSFSLTSGSCTLTGDQLKANSGTSLRYSGTPGVDGQFIQNWATPKVSTQTCYRVIMTTQDDSKRVAFFKFSK